jgi:hypothetical protein
MQVAFFRRVWVSLVSWWLAGCATAIAVPPLPANHPANPNAPEAAAPTSSATIRSYWTPMSVKQSPEDKTTEPDGRDERHH